MKNNKIWFIIAFLIIVCLGAGIYFFTKNNNSNNSNYSASKTSTNEIQSKDINYSNTNITNSSSNNNSITNNEKNNTNISENTSQNISSNNSDDIEKTDSNTIENNSAQQPTQSKEEKIASFSTKIYSKDSARQNNIEITCSRLNGFIIKNGSTFSFCNTLGPSNAQKGYQKADVFDKDGNKKKGFGGGNCQVSTTLYNAVSKLSNLQIIERHEHSNKVPYISDGKDAAVAYGSYDFKFKNNCGFDIKLSVSCTKNNVFVNLYKINV